MQELTIRAMTRAEVDVAVDWAAAEGWNPGLHDARCFFAADPAGFLVGLIDNEPVACISVVKYGQSFGFLGFYIVKPEHRGQGHGLKIWNAGMDSLQGRVVGLDGVVDQQDNYRKSGFDLAYRNIRRQGSGGCDAPSSADIVELSTLPFETINAYDGPLFPAQRPNFLRCWLNLEDSHALGILKNGSLAGYGLIRKCRQGHKIGPLFADTPELAEALFLALRSRLGSDELFYLDTPETNPAAVALADKYKMETVFETARMYKGPAPDMPLERIFGVTTFELG